MDQERFTSQPAVVAAIAEARRLARDRRYSDVVDGEGHQYVDLVMEGGGVLGVGLLGYTYALEECGIRFFSIGGASAGSIAALLLAGLDTKDRAKSARLAAELAGMDLWQLVDGDDHARSLIERFLHGASTVSLLAHGLRVVDTLWHDFGLNPGAAFCAWIDDILRRAGVATVRDLVTRVEHMPAGMRGPHGCFDKPARIALVAAELLSETKVELPRMAAMFWEGWEELPPSTLVRPSMSIPYFFQPVTVGPLPRTPAAEAAWKEEARWDGAPPAQALFVDGGTMSNFPINLFHRHDRPPTRPTFGVKLGKAGRTVQTVTNPLQLGVATFNAARHCLDFDFIRNHPDYDALVGHVDTKAHNWLDFALTESAQLDLFQEGVRAAADFLAKFTWDTYKPMRATLAGAYALGTASR
jgi:NTE family protein